MSCQGRLDKRRNKHRNFHTEVLRLENHVSYKDDWNSCKKSHRHHKFVELKDSKDVTDDADLLELIDVRSKLTGRLVIPLGDERQFGTCFVEQVKVLNEDQFWVAGQSSEVHNPKIEITVSTALHVATVDGKQIRADQCHIELDDVNNDDEQDKSRLLHGVEIYGVNEDADFCLLNCTTDNSDLIEELSDLVQRHYELGSLLGDRFGDMEEADRSVIMVSFPHGYGKRISTGKVGYKDMIREVRDNQDCCEYSYNTVTCPGSSGASVYIQGKWRDGFGYWFGYPHVHSGAYDEVIDLHSEAYNNFNGRSSEGVEAAY